MLKKLLGLVLCTLYLVLSISTAKAEGEFQTNVDVQYQIQENGHCEVKHAITLQNRFSNLYATSYSLVLDNIQPQNIRVYQDGKMLAYKTKEEGTITTLEVSFPDAVVGKDKSRKFNVVYDDIGIASRTGEVWEVSIPKLSADNTFSSYNLSFSIPTSFGQEAYLSPDPVKKYTSNNRRYYFFDKETVAKTGITAGFGEFQVFTFNLIYHLENPLVKNASIEIAIPPDTSLQKVYYESLIPNPINVTIDEDGNWLANYLLKPRERIDIEAKGSVQIFAGPRPFSHPSQELLAKNLAETEYWQSTNPEIIALAKQLKTPKVIYEYVTTTLSYNYERVKPNVTRFGAVAALKNPKAAICMEFTDLFIALARAAGIPAREINGFAYTENPEIQPLSLVSDVLHSWPEYWDTKSKTWVSIDPTWAATTGGIDFFSKLDLRHFTFVIHGADPLKPYPPGSYKLGPNPQKDVYVSFGRLPEKRFPTLSLTYQIGKFIPFFPQKSTIVIKNLGPASSINLPLEIFFDGKSISQKTIEYLPPFGIAKEEISIPFSFLGTKTPTTVTVTAGEENLRFSTFKKEVIIYNLAVAFILVCLILVTILIKFKKSLTRRVSQLILKMKNEKTDQSLPD